jgi:hypothetical protein
MKKVLFEVFVVSALAAVFLSYDAVRLPLVIAIACIGVWIVPFQLFLSIDLKTWMNEISGRFHAMPLEDRLAQIKSTFEGLTEMEAAKLRLFYIQACCFHYLLRLSITLGFIIVVILFLIGTVESNELLMTTKSLLSAIGVGAMAYFIVPKMYPLDVKKNLDEIFHLFTRRDWEKRLLREESTQPEIAEIKTFYDFWLQGKTYEEKKAAFETFIGGINAKSNNGILLKMSREDKIEVKCIVHAKGLSKSVAGLLKYCIEEQGVLSEQILRHRYRELLRDVFHLESLKSLMFLEGQRYKDTPIEYLNVYKSKS